MRILARRRRPGSKRSSSNSIRTALVSPASSRRVSRRRWLASSSPNERIRLRTTNAVEHDHAEVRRRTRVVRIFPNEASLLRLASALAMDRNEQWATRRYLLIREEEKLNRAWSRLRHSA